MSMMMCDCCDEIRDSDWIEFYECKDGDVCGECLEFHKIEDNEESNMTLAEIRERE